MASYISDDLRSGAMIYHRLPRPGKLEIQPTKPLANQRDLALAYTPGVAAVCEAIAADPALAAELTAKQNLVAVVSNGTAVLGLGNIGPVASKPVMEGKAVLFKKFAGIDVFDIEINALEVDHVVTVVAALEPTFGGINLEDIKAPECFEIERQLRDRMNIPVFHDDQHGTAIIVAAAIVNALHIGAKKIEDVKIVTSGAGAAAIATLNLLESMGARRENIFVTDIEGVVYEGREKLMDPYKGVFAQKTELRTLAEVIAGADIFIGLSAGGVLKPEMLKAMADRPLIMALANPTPEIMPELAREARPDAMICTGRSDFPNQVNNVLCFPFIFRGALDAGATTINEEMKIAAVNAIAELARDTPSDVVARAYGGETPIFGANSLIPSPFDPRLILRVAPAVAKAAMDSGVAKRPIADFEAYQEQLDRFVFRSGLVMKPIFTLAKQAPKRVIYAEGEDERILRAVQVVIEEGIARPILIGRPSVIDTRLQRFGLSIRPGVDFDLIDPEDDPRYRDYVQTYVERAGRRGVTPELARTLVRTTPTVIAAVAVMRGDADTMICGVEGRFIRHLRHIRTIIGLAPGVRDVAALSMLLTAKGAFFLCDTQVTLDPAAEDLAEMAQLAAAHVRRFGIEPKVALLSHSDFGSRDDESATKMRRALELIQEKAPDLMVDGEMEGDSALIPEMRERVLPGSRLQGVANILVMPNLDAANIGYQMVKVFGDALPVGPILLGPARPAHILTPSVTARGVVNMTAIAVVEAQEH
ncbi:malate dehydrogenase (oxaloacetate-decarboxylating)(NADP+) [Angulomicrobium tetraedrale]|uniref:Malate dehydrogenase (Oxaloacetate-decarboxylating)(NADP+) n=1 Tax=Ancylobacter tetraedralis TaxID=217068 RepID=A0A839Z3W8_9HYPH|nr:NADP-dependent malic enzyme [Ancylobacter tetraedralis]MBB3770309.1 malate dehydrogenase (oxaloacetate-decarboxylating)(NADP+) [Ancylobacter tetraedralis]